MKTRLSWDEAKRRANLRKHGLDFANAGEVLDSRYRLDAWVKRSGEDRGISFRRASREKREVYDVWLEIECDEA